GSPRPLCHATDQEVRCFGKADGLPIQIVDSILPDGAGGFWIGSDTAFVHWKAGVSEVYEPRAFRFNSGQVGILGLVRSPDGSLWVGIMATGRELGLERFVNGTFVPFATPNFDGTTITVTKLLMDRDGNLWVGTLSSGLYRVHGDVVDHFGAEDGLSSNTVRNLYEDLEVEIWVTTCISLDNY